MNADNVTPIRSGAEPPSSEPTKPRRLRSCPRDRFMLDEPPDGPSTMRVIQALHGVCNAAEQLAESRDPGVALELGTAAEILSTILQDRIVQ
jgi:hypothetical protein